MEEMKSSALERGMSRRSLLKWAGLATVGSAALGATGCVGFNEKTPISDTGDVDENPGEWRGRQKSFEKALEQLMVYLDSNNANPDDYCVTVGYGYDDNCLRGVLSVDEMT